MFTNMFRKTTEVHTIKVTDCRDFHIIWTIIEETIGDFKEISENNYTAKEDEKYVISFECTTKEFESIKKIMDHFNRSERINMKAEIN